MVCERVQIVEVPVFLTPSNVTELQETQNSNNTYRHSPNRGRMEPSTRQGSPSGRDKRETQLVVDATEWNFKCSDGNDTLTIGESLPWSSCGEKICQLESGVPFLAYVG